MKKALIIVFVAVFASMMSIHAMAADRGDMLGGGVMFPIGSKSHVSGNPYSVITSDSTLKGWCGLRGQETHNGPWGDWSDVVLITPDGFEISPNPIGWLVDDVYGLFGTVHDEVTFQLPYDVVKMINKRNSSGSEGWRRLEGYVELFGTGDTFLVQEGTVEEGPYIYLHYLTNFPWRKWVNNFYLGGEVGWSKVTLDGMVFGRPYAYFGGYLYPGDPANESIEPGCHWWYNDYYVTLLGGTGLATSVLDADAHRLSILLKARLVGDLEEIMSLVKVDWKTGRYFELFVGGGIGADYMWGDAEITAMVAHTGLWNHPSILLEAARDESFDDWSFAWFVEGGGGLDLPLSLLKKTWNGNILVLAIIRYSKGGGAELPFIDKKMGDEHRLYGGLELAYRFK